MHILNYGSRYIRLFATTAASIYITLRGRFSEINIAVVSPGFYIALAASLAIALIMVNIVHYSSIYLDKRYGWNNPLRKRIWSQLLLGVALPLIADLLLISVFFGAKKQNIINSGFLKYDFGYVVILVLIFNLYYCIHYNVIKRDAQLNQSILKPQTRVLPVEESTENFSEHADGTDSNLEFYIIDTKGGRIVVNPLVINYFFRLDRIIEVGTTEGIKYSHNDSITDIENRFKDVGFIRIKRGFVIKLDAIESYKRIKKNTYDLFLKPAFVSYFEILPDGELVVTGNYVDGFLSRFPSTAGDS